MAMTKKKKVLFSTYYHCVEVHVVSSEILSQATPGKSNRIFMNPIKFHM